MEADPEGGAVSDLRERLWRRVAAAVLLVAGLLLSACLGQDFRDAPLELERLDHGWRVNVEPTEEFSVGLVANPLYLDVPWQLADFDATVVEFAGSEHITAPCTPTQENPCPESALQESFVPHTIFRFTGVTAGESRLSFELEADGQVVDVCEYTISVVEDACEGDVGIAANRCGLGARNPNLEVGIYEHGGQLTIEPGETFVVTLGANAMYPDAPWQVGEIDPSVLTLQGIGQDPARSPGDWDTSDRDKPWHFLPLWRLTFEGVDPGESSLVVEAVADGARVEVFEITVSVGEGTSADGEQR